MREVTEPGELAVGEAWRIGWEPEEKLAAAMAVLVGGEEPTRKFWWRPHSEGQRDRRFHLDDAGKKIQAAALERRRRRKGGKVRG